MLFGFELVGQGFGPAAWLPRGVFLVFEKRRFRAIALVSGLSKTPGRSPAAGPKHPVRNKLRS
jgi:hypothetical protein